jgi:hypothetical protein
MQLFATNMHRNSRGLDAIFAMSGAPGLRVRLQIVAGDFSGIVVAHFVRDV